MRWTVAHVVASVVASLLFLGVSCMPASLEKENFVARLHIERRGVASPRSVNDSTPLYNATNDNSTVSSSSPGVVGHVAEYVMRNVGVIYRGLAVLGCISAIVVVYITYRYFRLHWQKSKTRKYGLITMPDDKLELKPLEEDDEDDEDMTVFDRTKPRTMNSQTAVHKKSSKQICTEKV